MVTSPRSFLFPRLYQSPVIPDRVTHDLELGILPFPSTIALRAIESVSNDRDRSLSLGALFARLSPNFFQFDSFNAFNHNRLVHLAPMLPVMEHSWRPCSSTLDTLHRAPLVTVSYLHFRESPLFLQSELHGVTSSTPRQMCTCRIEGTWGVHVLLTNPPNLPLTLFTSAMSTKRSRWLGLLGLS